MHALMPRSYTFVPFAPAADSGAADSGAADLPSPDVDVPLFSKAAAESRRASGRLKKPLCV